MSGDQPEVERALARAVGALPGVLRLEPTLTRALARLSRSHSAPDHAAHHATGRSADNADNAANASDADDDVSDDDAADGVSITNSDDGVAVTVEISVVGPASALDTVVSVRKVVRTQLAQASLTAAAVSVKVLAVDTSSTEPTVPAQSDDEYRKQEQKHDEGHDHG